MIRLRGSSALPNLFIWLLCVVAIAAAHLENVNITLPWGTYRALSHDKHGDFYLFQDVRFAQAPVGPLRFQAPRTPDPVLEPLSVPEPNYGRTCLQVDVLAECAPKGGIGSLASKATNQTEDCLFLDVYAPKSVFNGSRPAAPVVVWFYGGAFVYGSKNHYGPDVPLYSGKGMIQAAAEVGQDLIFVVGNYRLGALGWLSGTTMERDALPNAGLYDQRLVLEWVQKYIHLVNGDRHQVSAWGESAGAGAIMHHLIAKNGTQDPLFSKAFLQSPGYEWQWDRSGYLESLFQRYAALANCSTGGIPCLQSIANTSILDLANRRLFESTWACEQMFPLGPAVDGQLIYSLSPLALSRNHIWPLSSVIISHVADEASLFVDKAIKDEPTFDAFLLKLLPQPHLALVRAAIKSQYPLSAYSKDQRKRAAAVIRDSSFTCNTRYLFDAAQRSNTTAWMMQYNYLDYWGAAMHAADILPTFWTADWDLVGFLKNQLPAGYFTGLEANWVGGCIADLAPAFQSYFMSHAVAGDPNRYRREGNPVWGPARDGEDGQMGEVLDVKHVGIFGHEFYNASVDSINTRSACGFWREVAYVVTELTREVEEEGMEGIGGEKVRMGEQDVMGRLLRQGGS